MENIRETSLLRESLAFLQSQTKPGTLVGDNKIVSVLALAFLIRLGQAGFTSIPSYALRNQIRRTLFASGTASLAALLSQDALYTGNKNAYVITAELNAAIFLSKATYCIAADGPSLGKLDENDRLLFALGLASFGALLVKNGLQNVISGDSKEFYNSQIPLGLTQFLAGGTSIMGAINAALLDQWLASSPKLQKLQFHSYLPTLIPIFLSGGYLIKRSIDFINGNIAVPREEVLQFEVPKFGSIISMSNSAANISQLVLGSGLILGSLEYFCRVNDIERTILKTVGQAVKKGYQVVTNVLYKALETLKVPELVRAFISTNVAQVGAKASVTLVGAGSIVDGVRRLYNSGNGVLLNIMSGTEIALGVFGLLFGMNCIESVEKLKENQGVIEIGVGSMSIGAASVSANVALNILQTYGTADYIPYSSLAFGYIAALLGSVGVDKTVRGLIKWKTNEWNNTTTIDKNQIHAAALAALSYKWGADCYRSDAKVVNRFDNLVYRIGTGGCSIVSGLACFGVGAKVYDIILLAGFVKAVHVFYTQYYNKK